MTQVSKLNLGQYLKHIVSHINSDQELLFGSVITFKEAFDPNRHRFAWSRKFSFFLDELEQHHNHKSNTITYYTTILVVPKGLEFTKDEKKRYLSSKFSKCSYCCENSVLIEVVKDAIKCSRRVVIDIQEISVYDLWLANGFCPGYNLDQEMSGTLTCYNLDQEMSGRQIIAGEEQKLPDMESSSSKRKSDHTDYLPPNEEDESEYSVEEEEETERSELTPFGKLVGNKKKEIFVFPFK